MTPAELPKVSFFQLPYDQMKEGIMSAQMQQDTAREGISQIGDISFNYLTNSKVDPELAKGVYGELDQKTQGVLSKQGNGDLRGLRGEIYNLGKEVGRWYKPDGKIGRLQSNYLQYNDWYKRQTENKDIDKNYLGHMANKFINDYDAKGGAQAGTIHVEDLEKAPDVPKFIQDKKDLIKASVDAAAYAYTNGQYMYEGKSSYEALGPEKVRNVIAGLLQNDPEYSRFMKQAVTYDYYKPEQTPLLIGVENSVLNPKTGKTEIIKGTKANPLNPYASAIEAAAYGLSYYKKDQTKSMKSDPTRLDWLKFQKEQEQEQTPNFIINQGQPISIDTDPVNYTSRFEQDTKESVFNYLRPTDLNIGTVKGRNAKEDIELSFKSNIINKNGKITFDHQGYVDDLKKLGYSPKFYPANTNGYIDKLTEYSVKTPNFIDNSNMEFSAANPDDKKNEGTIFFNALSNAINGATGGGFSVVSSSLPDLDKKRIKGADSLIEGLVGQEVNGYTITGYDTKVIDKKGNIKLLLKGKKKGETESAVIPNSYTIIKAPERITEPLLDRVAVMNVKDANAYNSMGYQSTAKLSMEAAQSIATRTYDKPTTNAYRKMFGTAIGGEVDLGKEFNYTDPGTGKIKNPFNEKITIKVTGTHPKTGMPYGQVYVNGEPIGEEVTNEQEIKAVLIQAGKED